MGLSASLPVWNKAEQSRENTLDYKLHRDKNKDCASRIFSSKIKKRESNICVHGSTVKRDWEEARKETVGSVRVIELEQRSRTRGGGEVQGEAGSAFSLIHLLFSSLPFHVVIVAAIISILVSFFSRDVLFCIMHMRETSGKTITHLIHGHAWQKTLNHF